MKETTKKTTKKTIGKTVYILSWIVVTAILLLTAHALRRIFVADQFKIPTSSMEPTLIPGDRIIVNKLIFGARIYKSFDFSPGAPLECRRTPGRKEIQPNDVVVFNHPYGYKNREIGFRLNHVYAKRCHGAPGDTIAMNMGYLHNRTYELLIGHLPSQHRFCRMSDRMIDPEELSPGWLHAIDSTWTIRRMGPLYVPEKGREIVMDERHYRMYGYLVRYETGKEVTWGDGVMLLGGEPCPKYTFRENYYFFIGDNIANSNDSRHWGFVPEDFIIGVATHISFSRSPIGNYFRWDRLWKKLE